MDIQFHFWFVAAVIAVAATHKEVSFLVNGVEVKDGSKFEYDSNTSYNITCSSNIEDNSTSLALSMIRPENLENSRIEGAILEEKYYKSVHTINLSTISGNITRISCFLIESNDSNKNVLHQRFTKSTDFVRKSPKNPANLSSPNVIDTDCSSNFQTYSFTIGISVGIVVGISVTILLGLLCQFTMCRPPKPPRPPLPIPPSDPTYYSIVYSWRKPVLPPLPAQK